MTDDDLFRALAEAHRERDPLADPRWDALAKGSLPAAEREALRAASPETYALFAPLDEASQAHIADRILAGRIAPAAEASVVRLASVGQPRARAPSTSARARRALATFGAAATLAAAAAAVVFFRPAGAPLPPYTAAVAGELDVRALPADPGAVQRIGPGSSLDVVLRPATPVAGPLAARAFLVRGGRVRALSAPLQISDDGAVRLAGRYEALFAGEPPGPCEIAVVVGRTVPDDPAVVQAALAGRGGDLHENRLVRVPLLLVERP